MVAGEVGYGHRWHSPRLKEGSAAVAGTDCDAVVIGAGPNGLVAANALADAGWEVVVLEAQPEPGGAVRSARDLPAPGYTADLFSAFYPLAAASPVISGLELERFGLRWKRAPVVLAHPLADGRTALLHREPEDTAAALDEFAPGDGESWLALAQQWQEIRRPVLKALFTPFPPVSAGLRILLALRVAGALRLARLGLTPVRRLGEELFDGEAGRLLLTGNAMHADIPPDAAGSGVFGWLLAMLGQDTGFPVPEGGAGALTGALVARLAASGGDLRTSAPVAQVLVNGGRAHGVRLADGSTITARRAVLADVPAPALYNDLLSRTTLPARLRADLARFEWDHATVKLNWAVDGAIPWRSAAVSGAGTVHLGVDLDGFVDFAADLSTGRRPTQPFLLFGQMTTTDSSRSPAGTESAWAYTHLPRRLASDTDAIARHVEAMEHTVEEAAPGFGDLVVARHVQAPADLESANASLDAGAINAGTAALHQQLIFRPTVGLGRPETPVEALYLAGASAHPGGGVHGACGWNAARAALGAGGPLGPLRRALARTAWDAVLRD